MLSVSFAYTDALFNRRHKLFSIIFHIGGRIGVASGLKPPQNFAKAQLFVTSHLKFTVSPSMIMIVSPITPNSPVPFCIIECIMHDQGTESEMKATSPHIN